MRVSLNQIKQYIGFELAPVDELVATINAQLGGVEQVIDLGARYKDVVIAKVVQCDPHANADRLKVCRIDDGGVVEGVERGDDGLIQVVCGAPNVRAGLFVAWLPPKSIVPATAGDTEPFVLGARELRGQMSQGMLASPKELGLGDSHDGILELDPNEWKPSDIAIEAGASFGEAYGLDDTIIEIENKMFTHRPDLFGQLGVAREIAGIHHQQFVSPDWYKGSGNFNRGEGLDLLVHNDASEHVPRFMAVAVKDVSVKPSPVWLQAALVAMGSKPINNIVDVTNYIMLLTAQPTHAYDYDKLRGQQLGVRMAQRGETVTLLNHKTYNLDESDIVIIDGEGPVGLAGVMGGANSEVSSDTKRIVLEVASFDMYTVRRTSMKYGLFTEAVTRFNKGQSALQNPNIVRLLMSSISDVAGGTQASDVFDSADSSPLPEAVSSDMPFINARLGLQLDSQQAATYLRNVEFAVSTDQGLRVTAPFWRTDIELAEDIVEEIGRLYGFDKLPRELPRRSIAPPAVNAMRALKASVRQAFTSAGANEVLNYSFVHEKIMQRAGQDPSYAFKLSNALSPDLQYYRLSLMPSLLDKVHMNQKAGYDAFALYEIGKTHYKGEMDESEPDVPNEDTHVALIVAVGNKSQPNGSPYYHALRYMRQIVPEQPGLEMVRLDEFNISEDEWGRELTAAYEPTRSAVLVRDNQIWGVIGEFTQTVRNAFKLPAYCAGFELHCDIISPRTTEYVPLSRYPNVTQDVSLNVPSNTAYADVYAAAMSALETAADSVSARVSPITIYRPEGSSTKTITLRLTVVSYEKTLSDQEIRPMIDEIIASAQRTLNAEVV